MKLVKDTISRVKEQYSVQNNINNIPLSDLQFNISDQLFLETLLMEIRGATISYSTYKKRSQDRREITLAEEINEIERNFDISKENILKAKQNELLDIRKKKMEGVKNKIKSQMG